ncbi:HNH endonuclease signature motif containing protein [Oryzobacter sp. R7]|uniref:HNH endonuclease signature motif containing protein n=1 Tax=Oryzobacter faecalis TaxID=3388656 RepID=UPI00398D4F73
MSSTAPATSSRTGHPSELLALLHDTQTLLAALPAPSPTSGSRQAWAEVVRSCQRVVNAASAVQDEAIVALAAIEPVTLEDGTDAETHKAPGHVALDAAAVVSGALEVTANHASDRVRDAVRWAADGEAGTSACTGLGGLHDAMRTGDLDRYRAGVVAHELEEAPAQVAEAVIATLGEHLASETGVQLRRRTRRLLARVSPDLLRQRAQRARQECGLRRRVGEPGVDVWEGSFPSEQAAKAWAAIDTRAHQLVTDGAVDRIDRARAQALIDLVMQSATVTTVITLTVPADHPATAPVPEPITHPAPAADARTATATGEDPTTVAAADRLTAGDAVDGGFVEVATGRGTEQVLVPTAWLTNQLAAANAPTPVRGTGPGTEPSPANPNTQDTVRVETRSCDPVTGALLSDEESGAYRPPERLAALVRHRDGRCRFPGCSVAARYCDLDHVRPWPDGSTTASNLMCLCRRHHRVKQRPGWHVNLHPDGTVTWTDPTGRSRTTAPVDALHSVTLPATPAAATGTATPAGETAPPGAVAAGSDRPGTPAPRAVSPDRFSHLEYALEHLLGADLTTLPARTRRTTNGSGVRVSVIRPADTITVLEPHRPCRRPGRRSDRFSDEPPF